MFCEQNDKLWTTLADIAADEGLELYDLERRGPGGLRVYISKQRGADTESRQGGVTSDDCSKLCRRLMTFFMVEGPNFGLNTEPEVEVSSPGVNRELRLADHYAGAVGERVKIIFRNENGAITPAPLIGKLKAMDQHGIHVLNEMNSEECTVPLNEIKRAQVDFLFK